MADIENASETSPLLEPIPQTPLDQQSPQEEIQPSGTLLSSYANLSNTILGTGMLAMPHALSQIGIIPGLLLILFASLASILGLMLLELSAQSLNSRETSFYAVSQRTFPWSSLVLDTAIAIKCFGVSFSLIRCQ